MKMVGITKNGVQRWPMGASKTVMGMNAYIYGNDTRQ